MDGQNASSQNASSPFLGDFVRKIPTILLFESHLPRTGNRCCQKNSNRFSKLLKMSYCSHADACPHKHLLQYYRECHGMLTCLGPRRVCPSSTATMFHAAAECRTRRRFMMLYDWPPVSRSQTQMRKSTTPAAVMRNCSTRCCVN